MTPAKYSEKLTYAIISVAVANILAIATGLIYAFILKPLFTM